MYANFKGAITEIHPQIPWEMVADPLGSAELSFGNAAKDGVKPQKSVIRVENFERKISLELCYRLMKRELPYVFSNVC